MSPDGTDMNRLESPALREGFMHMPLDELTLEELRERHTRAFGAYLGEIKREKEAAYDYWAKVRAQEHAALARVQQAIYANGSKKTISVDVIECALSGETMAGELL
jgi:hypothetical protein